VLTRPRRAVDKCLRGPAARFLSRRGPVGTWAGVQTDGCVVLSWVSTRLPSALRLRGARSCDSSPLRLVASWASGPAGAPLGPGDEPFCWSRGGRTEAGRRRSSDPRTIPLEGRRVNPKTQDVGLQFAAGRYMLWGRPFPGHPRSAGRFPRSDRILPLPPARLSTAPRGVVHARCGRARGSLRAMIQNACSIRRGCVHPRIAESAAPAPRLPAMACSPVLSAR
jgi:hypothetical protein